MAPLDQKFKLLTQSTADSHVYEALAFQFLAKKDIHLFEENVDLFAKGIRVDKLAEAILQGYTSSSAGAASKDDLLWLLSHFIALGQVSLNSSQEFFYLNTLYTQISALSSEISMRVDIKPMPNLSDHPAESLVQPLEPYVSRQLSSLVDHDGISRLLQNFLKNLAESSNQQFEGTSLLAGYILALLQSFPSNADDTRMRLFLGQIPTSTGEIPTVKFLWQIMRQTSVFRKLKTESEQPANVIRNYLRGASHLSHYTVEEQEWRIILLFLEIYIFILLLSDDEDFFSGIYPQLLENTSSPSRIRSCSLSLQDVEALTIFLKNTAFALLYKAQQISQSLQATSSSARLRPDSSISRVADFNSVTPTKLDLDSLRGIVTTTLKMLYERDSRKQFLPVGHWLMTNKLDNEGFVTAVIAEEERQAQEEAEESSDDEDDNSTTGSILNPSAGSFSTVAGQRVSRHLRFERLRAQQSRAQRDRRLAELGPKLEVLKHMPFVVPFETRVTIFRQFIHLDRIRRDGAFPFIAHPFAKHHARIRRGQLFEDAFEQFYQLGDGLKDPIQITFVDQFDTPEAGIDGGGVTKEFLISVTSEAFGNEHQSVLDFTSNEKGLLYPNPIAMDRVRETLRQLKWTEADPEWREAMTGTLKRFEFLGRIIGKCMYEGILVDLSFAGFFLLKWSSSGANEENGYKGSINDLKDMDEELYNGIIQLKNYPGDVSELGFDFTINDQISGPREPVKTVTRKLIPNGDQVSVNNDNRPLYISYAARHRLVVQPGQQTSAFLHGLRAIIRPSWLSMFNQSELQRLVGGDSSEIDIEDLRRNTVYSGVYEIGDDHLEHPTIQLFWKVMASFTDAQRRDVLKYVSSTPRAPLLGFSQLRPQFSIRDAGTDETRLPSTSTCVNLLKLPRYSRESTLREKLLYAISSGAGFDLS